jgi:hypothetical protein
MDDYPTATAPRPTARPVTSRPLPESRPSSHGPISRSYLRAAKSPARVIAGLAFIAYSSAATIQYVNSDLSSVLQGRLWIGMQAGYVLGLLLAIAITGWEWLAADEPFVWYALPLALDSWYTYRMTVPWVALIVQAQIDTPATATATAIIISAVSSVAVALFGERLLFGRRR